MNAASWVNSIAATSSTFEHVSGIVKKAGWRRQRGCSFAMGFVTHSRGSASQKNTPMRGDHGKKIEKWVGATGGSYNFQITLPIVRTVSSLNHRQTLFQLKTQAVFKFPVVCNFFSPKISTNKKPFCYDSGKCWAVNMKNWEDFLLNPPKLVLTSA